MPDYPKPEVV